MTDEIRGHAEQLAKDLEAAGHGGHAEQLRQALGQPHPVEEGFLWTLRNICDTLVTMLEAIDPVSELTLEGLRRRLDAKLSPPAPHDPAAG